MKYLNIITKTIGNNKLIDLFLFQGKVLKR